MLGQADAGGEGVRYLAAVDNDMAHLARAQPEPQDAGKQYGAEKNERERRHRGRQDRGRGSVTESPLVYRQGRGDAAEKLWHKIKTLSSGWTWK
jgi:hypothetical protein